MKTARRMISRHGNSHASKLEIAPAPANIEPGALTVRGSGKAWAVFHGDVALTTNFTCHFAAVQAANAIEYRSRLVERPCITCGTPMLSTGRHHRMCNTCRANAQEIA